MTQITFLHGAPDRLQAVAAWLSGSAARKLRILVYVPERQNQDHLDRLLWAQPPIGFTPHCLAENGLATQTPILLASKLDHLIHDECLVNFSDSTPPGFSRFQKIIEIVGIDDHSRIAGRERFRFYRERGYPLEARDISQGV